MRPLVALALALGAGTWLGLVAGEGRAGPALGALAAAAVGLGLLARLGRAPRWAAWILVAGFARASGVAVPAPRGAADGQDALRAVEAASARARPIAGTFRAERAGRSGWIEPRDGAPAGPPLLVEPAGIAPRDGTPVVLLAGGAVEPWPRGPALPGGSRARRFAARAPVLADELVRVGPEPRAPWAPLADELAALRGVLAERVRTLEREDSAGLLVALAVGDRAGIALERADLFTRTGTAHLLALSGWHVGLFALLVLRPLCGARARGVAWVALQAALLAVFAALAGAEKPIVRAAVALVLGELAAVGGRAVAPPRRPDALSALAAAFALECGADPAGIRSLSLALSYAATLGLVLGTGAFTARLRAVLRAPQDRKPRWRPFAPSAAARAVRVLATRLGDGFVRGLAASAAAVLATLPFAWTAFGELAPAGVLVTVLVMPLFTLLSVVAWLGALAPLPWLAPVAELGARAFYGLLALGDALPGTPLVLPPRPAALVALACALPFVAARGAAGRWPGRLACVVWGALLLPWSAAPRGLELVALDVGHGTSVVARAPGLEALVFDAGSRDRRGVATEALVPLLAAWDVARPHVVLSHGHLDHASGLARLVERYPVPLWLGAVPAQAGVRLPHGTRRLDLARGRLAVASACPELRLALLRGVDGPGNEGSRALELAWRGARVLLAGDAEEAGLSGLALAPGPLRLLLAPHHGAAARGLSPLLARTPPAEVWISAARRTEIEPELARRGIPFRSTARDGFLALRLP